MKKLSTFEDKALDRQINEIVQSANTPLQVFANNVAAIAGGLAPGKYYRTGADPDVVCVVH